MAHGNMATHSHFNISIPFDPARHANVQEALHEHLMTLKLPKPPRECAQCGKGATKICGGCKGVRYCSAACQREHRPVHKKDCNMNHGRMRALGRYIMGREPRAILNINT